MTVMEVDEKTTPLDRLSDSLSSLFDPVELYHQIGYGGFSRVYKGQFKKSKESVAIKFFSTSYERMDDARRLEFELITANELEHHKILSENDSRIPKIHVSQMDEESFAVMEFVDFSLEDVVSNGNQSMHEAHSLYDRVRVVGDVAEIVAYVHDHGTIHGDINTRNVLLKGDGSLNRSKVMLSDFGNARKFRQHFEESILGTIEYMPPESIEGKASPQQDIFALGVLFYEMLSEGRMPRERHLNDQYGWHKTITEDKIQPLVSKDRRVNQFAQRIANKALNPDPKFRYKIVDQFLDDLRTYQHSIRQ